MTTTDAGSRYLATKADQRFNRLAARLTRMGLSLWGSRRAHRGGSHRQRAAPDHRREPADGGRRAVPGRSPRHHRRGATRPAGEGQLRVGRRTEAFVATEWANRTSPPCRALTSSAGPSRSVGSSTGWARMPPWRAGRHRPQPPWCLLASAPSAEPTDPQGVHARAAHTAQTHTPRASRPRADQAVSSSTRVGGAADGLVDDAGGELEAVSPPLTTISSAPARTATPHSPAAGCTWSVLPTARNTFH